MANTATQLAQYALNLAVASQNQVIQGQAEVPNKGSQQNIWATLIMLAEAIIVINNSNTGGGTIPGALLTGKYSVTQPSTTPIQL